MIVDESGVVRLSVHGMDDRSMNTFYMFLQELCGNKGVLVSDQSADASVIDMDAMHGPDLVSKQKEAYPDRPIIALSIAKPREQGLIHVQKPIQAQGMLDAFEAVKQLRIQSLGDDEVETEAQSSNDDSDIDTPVIVERPVKTSSQIHKSAHRTAMLLDERSYRMFVGGVADIDPTDTEQLELAHYDTQKYLLAYVQSAMKLAVSKNRILRLHCGWKPITIFPHAREIWVDSDDKQLRAFCVVPIKSVSSIDVGGTCKASKIRVTPVDLSQESGSHDPARFQSMEAFLWKLALWTSNGRVPAGIRLDQPVFLRHWPNLSRFVVIPHSLRIAALLVEQPKTLLEVADLLQIPQQYVFSFFSAAWAIGLAGQVKRQSDGLIPASPAIQTGAKQGGILQKIIAKLRIK